MKLLEKKMNESKKRDLLFEFWILDRGIQFQFKVCFICSIQ